MKYKDEQEKKEFLRKWGPLNPFKISLARFKRRQMRLVSFSEAENLFLWSLKTSGEAVKPFDLRERTRFPGGQIRHTL